MENSLDRFHCRESFLQEKYYLDGDTITGVNTRNLKTADRDKSGYLQKKDDLKSFFISMKPTLKYYCL